MKTLLPAPFLFIFWRVVKQQHSLRCALGENTKRGDWVSVLGKRERSLLVKEYNAGRKRPSEAEKMFCATYEQLLGVSW